MRFPTAPADENVAIAQILADAVEAEALDLGDADACYECLVARGIRPVHMKGTLLEARIEAHNLCAARHWARKSVRTALGALPVLLLALMLGTVALSGLASAGQAAQHETSIMDDLTVLALAAACIVVVVIAGLTTKRKDRA